MSRPPSGLSLNGSSGYGSTRSQRDVLLTAGYTGSLKCRKSVQAILFSASSTLPYRRNTAHLPRPASAGPHPSFDIPEDDGDVGIPTKPRRPKPIVLADRNTASSAQNLLVGDDEQLVSISPKPQPRLPRPPHVYFNVPRPINGTQMKVRDKTTSSTIQSRLTTVEVVALSSQTRATFQTGPKTEFTLFCVHASRCMLPYEALTSDLMETLHLFLQDSLVPLRTVSQAYFELHETSHKFQDFQERNIFWY